MKSRSVRTSVTYSSLLAAEVTPLSQRGRDWLSGKTTIDWSVCRWCRTKPPGAHLFTCGHAVYCADCHPKAMDAVKKDPEKAVVLQDAHCRWCSGEC